MPLSRLATCSLTILTLACAASGPGSGPFGSGWGSGGGDPSGFPSREQLDDLAERDAPGPPAPEPAPAPDAEPAARDLRVAVDTWSLAGPFPERVGDEPLEAPGPWERALLRAAERRAGLLAVPASMRCVAHEAGRFVLEHGALPDPSLERFIAGRCGATAANLMFAWIDGRIPPDRDDAYVLESWGPRLEAMVAAQTAGGPRSAGIWYGRRDDLGIALLVTGTRRVRIEPLRPLPDAGGGVWLEGELLGRDRDVSALVTRGGLGVRDCEPDVAVRAPRFRIRCPLAPDDDRAWIELAARAPGRLLWDGVLEVLARPAGGREDTYRAPEAGRAGHLDEATDLAAALVREVNRLREDADRPPLALESAQSRVADELAPLLLAANAGAADPLVGDTILLGLLAGWDVDAVIRDGSVGALGVSHTRDLDRWLGEALDRPSLRRTLLSAEHSRIAVGDASDLEQPRLAAVLATWTTFAGADHDADRERLYARVREAFQERGLRPPARDTRLEGDAGEVALGVRNGLDPETGLDALIQAVSARGVQGNVLLLEASELDALVLPDDLFEGDVQRLALGVGHHRPRDAAWGRYVVYVVVAREAALRADRRLTPPAGRSGT